MSKLTPSQFAAVARLDQIDDDAVEAVVAVPFDERRPRTAAEIMAERERRAEVVTSA